VTADGTEWRAGVTHAGGWGDVFEVRDFKIQRLYVYLDPDYAGADTARYPWLNRRERTRNRTGGKHEHTDRDRCPGCWERPGWRVGGALPEHVWREECGAHEVPLDREHAAGAHHEPAHYGNLARHGRRGGSRREVLAPGAYEQ